MYLPLKHENIFEISKWISTKKIYDLIYQAIQDLHIFMHHHVQMIV